MDRFPGRSESGLVMALAGAMIPQAHLRSHRDLGGIERVVEIGLAAP